MHKNMPATTWQAWVHVFNYFTCLLDRGGSFVTKNGYGRLVVMDIDYYEKTMRKMDEATTILDGLKDVKSGNTVEGETAISKIRCKYGI